MSVKMKKLLSLILCIALCASVVTVVAAQNESNDDGIVFSAELDHSTLYVSDEDQTVVMTIKAEPGVKFCGMGMTLTHDAALSIISVQGGEAVEGNNPVGNQYDPESKKLGWSTSNTDDISNVTDLLIVTVKVPANTPEGTYEIGAEAIEMTDSYGLNTWENGATVSATLTITEPQGYAAKISAAATNPNPIRVGQTFKVNVGSNMDFASTEITITYPANLVLFDENLSSLGTATINAETAGIIKLADYGADKTAAPDNYVFAFYALNDGEASFSITAAGFGTGESAETADLTTARLPNALGITIDKSQYTVTMDDIFTGNSGVNHGETYYFYPESATGAYYTYYEVIVQKDGQNVNWTNADGGGWMVENVTGNLVITGQRTPSLYGVYWKGDNWSDVTSRPDHATYSMDFTFELPPDQPAGTEDGYRYEVRVEIGTEEYTGYTKDGQKYTIPGADIIDGIDIYVTKVPVYATQYTVTINGESGVVADNYTPSKGSNVVLQLTPEPGYKYEVEVNGAKVDFINNRYTITNVQANVTVNVTRSLDLSSANAVSFATLDATNLYLVLVGNQRIEGKTYTYNGTNMYWSSKYNAYAILVFGANTPALTDFALITVDVIPTVEYDGDVNGTTNVDANDAQLVYNMYNAKYSAFEGNITMEKFLEADMNGDKEINSEDAVVIINQILNIND